MSLHIQLEKFEGPLGLLLYLIKKDEMDIMDINVRHVTQQYLEYIKAMRRLDLEVAGDFIAMAATLIHIKSRMLLPQYDEDGEEVEVEDPRRALVQKLLEYQKFQEASIKLYERPLLGRDIWSRGERTKVVADENDEVLVEEENALFALIASYRYAIKNMQRAIHKVGADIQSIASRIMELKDRLIVGKKVMISELIEAKATKEHRAQKLVTFLSILELTKLGFLALFQSEPLADIHITAKKVIDGNILTSVEGYSDDTQKKIENLSYLMTKEPELGRESGQEIEIDFVVDEKEKPEQILLASAVREEDQPIIVEAATNEDILAEERKMNLEPEEIEKEKHIDLTGILSSTDINSEMAQEEVIYDNSEKGLEL